MTRFAVKVVVTALVLAAISELGRRHTAAAAILDSLPINSMLVMIWLYRDTLDTGRVAQLASAIVWAIPPSLVFFFLLPRLLHLGVRFYAALGLASLAMGLTYAAYSRLVLRA